MTVRVERTFELPVERERVWAFISDPEKRAESISVVTRYSLEDPEGRVATWHVKLPIPLINGTVTVHTEDVTRTPPEYVKFVGRSKVMNVTGEHFVEEFDGGSRLVNKFVVEGRLPGVERFFKHNLDDELDNLERALREDLGLDR